jgi:hypothetical protein
MRAVSDWPRRRLPESNTARSWHRGLKLYSHALDSISLALALSHGTAPRRLCREESAEQGQTEQAKSFAQASRV